MMMVKVPKKALIIPSMMEDGEEVTPEVGDPVDMHVKGSVQEIKGDHCMVKVAFVNGQRCEEKEEKQTSREKVRKEAQDADKELYNEED